MRLLLQHRILKYAATIAIADCHRRSLGQVLHLVSKPDAQVLLSKILCHNAIGFCRPTPLAGAMVVAPICYLCRSSDGLLVLSWRRGD